MCSLSSLMHRLALLSTTWPQTCSTTWSFCRRFSWRKWTRSFRKCQVLWRKLSVFLKLLFQLLLLFFTFLPTYQNHKHVPVLYPLCAAAAAELSSWINKVNLISDIWLFPTAFCILQLLLKLLKKLFFLKYQCPMHCYKSTLVYFHNIIDSNLLSSPGLIDIIAQQRE